VGATGIEEKEEDCVVITLTHLALASSPILKHFTHVGGTIYHQSSEN
jgi:hypothetical protein